MPAFRIQPICWRRSATRAVWSTRRSRSGLLEARQAVVADFARRGLTTAADRIALTASTSEAYSLLFKLLCAPGDEVLIPRPSYPLFDHLTRLDAVTPVPYDLEYHGAWSIDVGSIERGVQHANARRAARQPQQPDRLVRRPGRARGDRRALPVTRRRDHLGRSVCRLRVRRRRPRRSGLLLGRTDVVGFTLGGLSKSIGLPQAKLAWIAISGADDRCVAARGAPGTGVRHVSFRVDAGPTRCRRASRSVERPVREQIQERVRSNYQALDARVSDVPSCELLDADGGWSAVLRVPSIMSEEDLVLGLLDRRRRARASGILLRLPARVVSRREPPSAGRTVCRRDLAHSEPIRSGERSPVNQHWSPPRWPAHSAFLLPVVDELGHWRHRRHRAGDEVARRRGPARPAAAAAQRDGLRPAVAVLRDERDGDRSDLHSRHRGAGVRRARRRAVAEPPTTGLGLHACDERRTSTIPPSARLKQQRLARRVRAVSRARVELRHGASARASGDYVDAERWWIDDYALFRALHERERAGRGREWPAPLRASRSAGARGRSPRARRRDPVPPVPAVDCRRAVAARARRGARTGVAAVRRLAVHGRWRQRRRLGAPVRLRPRRLGRRAARRVQRDRAGLGHAGVPLGGHRAGRFRLAARPRAAKRGALRRLSHRSSRRLLSHVFAAAKRRRRRPSSQRPSRSNRSSANASCRCFASLARKSLRRIWASFPTSCARRSARRRIAGFRVFRWEREWNADGQPFRDPPATRRYRSPRRAHTTPNPWRSGGTRRLIAKNS